MNPVETEDKPSKWPEWLSGEYIGKCAYYGMLIGAVISGPKMCDLVIKKPESLVAFTQASNELRHSNRELWEKVVSSSEICADSSPHPLDQSLDSYCTLKQASASDAREWRDDLRGQVHEHGPGIMVMMGASALMGGLTGTANLIRRRYRIPLDRFRHI